MLASLPEKLRRVTGSTDFIPAIDGLRFLAIAPVVFWHMGSRAWRAYAGLPGEPSDFDKGFNFVLSEYIPAKTGVELFFVISGFIIAFPFLKAAFSDKNAPKLGVFYTRRLTRLEPPYILATLGVFAFLVMTGASLGKSFDGPAGSYTLLESVGASLVYMHGIFFRTIPETIPVAWSLEVEFQFYVLAPFMLMAYLLVRNHMARIAMGLGIIAVLLVQINITQSLIGDLNRFVLPRFLHFFFIGIVFCDVMQHVLRRPPGRKALFDAAFVIGFVGVILLEPLTTDYRRQTPLGVEVLRVFCFFAVIAGAFYGGLIPRLLSNRWITAFGGMCYTIYLIHLPVQEVLVPKVVRFFEPGSYLAAWALSLVLTMPIVMAICIAFFLVIEKPCMRRDWPQRLWGALRQRVKAAT